MKSRHIAAIGIFVTMSMVIAFATVKIWTTHGFQGMPKEIPQSHPRSIKERIQTRSDNLISIASPTNLQKFEDVKSLTSKSHLIITGQVKALQSKLGPDEDFIFTDCPIKVHRIITNELTDVGDLSEIIVQVPGGRVEFENGKFAEVRLPEFWQNPVPGETYVFFLVKSIGSHFNLVGGPQGLFRINTEKKIQSQTRPDDVLARLYQGRNMELFVSEILVSKKQTVK
jgi:hypothetical protein